MKIGDSVVMFADVTPNRLGMGMVTVEGTVYELDLRDLFIQKKLKLFFHQLQAAQADRFIYGRKTVAATVRAAAAGFVVNDTVVEITNVLFVVEKRDVTDIREAAGSGAADGKGACCSAGSRDFACSGVGLRSFARFFRGSSENNAWDFLQCILFICIRLPRSGGKLIFIKYKQIVEGHLSLTHHNPGEKRHFPQDFFRIVGYFRSAQPNRHIRQDLGKFPGDILNHFPVPDIAGKRDAVRLSAINVRQYLLEGLVDGVFGQLHMLLKRRLLPDAVGAQAVNGRVGMDIFCIHCCE